MTDRGAGNGAGAWLPPASATTAPAEEPIAEERPRARTGWTPPPRRGLVPLRPLPFGTVLSAPFRLQRRAPRTTLAPALVVSLVATILSGVAGWALVAGPLAALDAAYYEDYLVAEAVLGVLGGVAGFVSVALAFAATALLGGLVAVAVSRAVVAERVSWKGALWRLGGGRLPRLVGWSLLVLGAGLLLLALCTLPALAAALTPYAGPFLSLLVGMLEFTAVALLGGYLAARLGFTTHAIALEGWRLGPAVRRSWTLTRGAGWRLWSYHLAVWSMVMVASWVLTEPIGWALDGGVTLLFPNGMSSSQGEAYLLVRTVVTTAVTAVAGAFGLVLQTVTGALMYLDTRMRAEGLDLALARYADERQRGAAPADPFPSGGAR